MKAESQHGRALPLNNNKRNTYILTRVDLEKDSLVSSGGRAWH